MADQPTLTADEVVAILQHTLLGEEPTLTGIDLADRVGIPIEVAKARWRSLGFTEVPDDLVAFTEADAVALSLTERLHAMGVVDPGSEAALIRTFGRSFARLAEWQVELLARVVDIEAMDHDDVAAVTDEVTGVLQELMSYVWRRHSLSAASRMLLSPEGDSERLAVGFSDIVDYTRRSRSLTSEELEGLVEAFEGTALEIITSHGGRIIKTIGDEILFVADTPQAGARIAVDLAGLHERGQAFPQLRVGLAWGGVLPRLGDVYGPTVNLASRLTSLARPGRILVDRDLAEELRRDDETARQFRLKRSRRTSVKGYRHLEPWSLKGPRPERDAEGDPLPGPASQPIYEHGQHLVRAVDEGHPVLPRPFGRKG